MSDSSNFHLISLMEWEALKCHENNIPVTFFLLKQFSLWFLWGVIDLIKLSLLKRVLSIWLWFFFKTVPWFKIEKKKAVKNGHYKIIPGALPTIKLKMSSCLGANWSDSVCHARVFKGPLDDGFLVNAWYVAFNIHSIACPCHNNVFQRPEERSE